MGGKASTSAGGAMTAAAQDNQGNLPAGTVLVGVCMEK